MHGFCKELLDLEKRYIELCETQFSGTVERFEVKSIVMQRADAIREVMLKTNSLIHENIKPYLLNPEMLNLELAESFEELATELSSHQAQIDAGLAFELREAIGVFYKKTNNVEAYIRNAYWKGITAFYFDAEIMNEAYKQSCEEVVQFVDLYDKFDEETRKYIVRAYGNLYVSAAKQGITEFFTQVERVLYFWEHIARLRDPHFPWEAFYTNLHDNICSRIMPSLRDGVSFSQMRLDQMSESAAALFQAAQRLEEAKSRVTNSSRYIYMYYSASYFTSKISLQEFLDKLLELYYDSPMDDYSEKSVYEKLHIFAIFKNMIEFDVDKKLDRELYMTVINEMEQENLEFIMKIPKGVSQSYVTTMLVSYAAGASFVKVGEGFLRHLLKLTVFSHKPTYVHSVMVGKIAYLIAQYFWLEIPEYFIGISGTKTVEEVKLKRDEILDFVWISALCHDMGKISYTHIVSFCVRSLNDYEFKMIKEHPAGIKKVLQGDKIEGQISEILDVALYHHISYDGKFGYPCNVELEKVRVKNIIHLIAVADSIDAATDICGRSYHAGKSFETVKQEILESAGTRYCPECAKLLQNNQSLCEELKMLIDEFRYEIYYNCFDHNEVESMIEAPRTGVAYES